MITTWKQRIKTEISTTKSIKTIASEFWGSDAWTINIIESVSLHSFDKSGKVSYAYHNRNMSADRDDKWCEQIIAKESQKLPSFKSPYLMPATESKVFCIQ